MNLMNEKIISFPITGNSMWPTIASGETLLIESSDNNFEIGDILLYKSKTNADYIVHRLIQFELMKGDDSILYDQKNDFLVFGKVVGVVKMNKTIIWGNAGQPLKVFLSKISHFRTKGPILRKCSKVLLHIMTRISFSICSGPTKDHT